VVGEGGRTQPSKGIEKRSLYEPWIGGGELSGGGTKLLDQTGNVPKGKSEKTDATARHPRKETRKTSRRSGKRLNRPRRPRSKQTPSPQQKGSPRSEGEMVIPTSHGREENWFIGDRRLHSLSLGCGGVTCVSGRCFSCATKGGVQNM